MRLSGLRLTDVLPLSPFERSEDFERALLLVALVAVPGAPRLYREAAQTPPRTAAAGRRSRAVRRHQDRASRQTPRARAC